MPQGVEHGAYYGKPFRFLFVIHSLMPQGVEHMTQDELTEAEQLVIHSLMPQGVEHTNPLGSATVHWK